jgi:hypothetical protein
VTTTAEGSRDQAARAFRLACVVVLGIVVAGLAAIPIASSPDYRAYSLFYGQFADIELPALAFVGVWILTLLFLAKRAKGSVVPGDESWPLAGWIRAPWLAAAVFAVVWIGVRFVFRGYAFTDDEYSALFQSTIFASGRTSVPVPGEWCHWVGALTPTSIVSTGCMWRLSFLPLHSLFRAPFIALGVDEIGGAVTAVLSLVLVARIAGKLWPDRPHRAALAALFFATSTQLLFMSMTFFSMPTHLLLSLVWLWLYVDNRRWSLIALPWVGVLALGVLRPLPPG